MPAQTRSCSVFSSLSVSEHHYAQPRRRDAEDPSRIDPSAFLGIASRDVLKLVSVLVVSLVAAAAATAAAPPGTGTTPTAPTGRAPAGAVLFRNGPVFCAATNVGTNSRLVTCSVVFRSAWHSASLNGQSQVNIKGHQARFAQPYPSLKKRRGGLWSDGFLDCVPDHSGVSCINLFTGFLVNAHGLTRVDVPR